MVGAGCTLKYLPTEMGNPKWGLDVTWNGHSCFTLEDSVGRTLVIDPFDETVGYGRLSLRADALLITHRHFDHDFARAVKPRLNDFQLIESTGTTSVASGLLVTGLTSFHDNEDGQIHGSNLIYTFVMGGLRCLHVGDLGQNRLTPYQKKIIGVVDVLFVPVGGGTTINAVQAKALVDELKPGMVFPMHYGDVRFYKFDAVEKFTALFPPERINKINGSTVRIREADRTAEPVIYILNSKGKS
jgi:L-ascorbate metabolism protein UlaG (beta-lactamase superfamily)